MSTQHISLPAPASLSYLQLGPNDSSINRGDGGADGDDIGDNEARPDEMGSGPAQPTADPTSFGGSSSIRDPSTDSSALEQEVLDDDSFEIVEATDGRLGLTNIGNKPADDWAPDTLPTMTPEARDNK